LIAFDNRVEIVFMVIFLLLDRSRSVAEYVKSLSTNHQYCGSVLTQKLSGSCRGGSRHDTNSTTSDEAEALAVVAIAKLMCSDDESTPRMEDLPVQSVVEAPALAELIGAASTAVICPYRFSSYVSLLFCCFDHTTKVGIMFLFDALAR
jgi:hypothetical protein